MAKLEEAKRKEETGAKTSIHIAAGLAQAGNGLDDFLVEFHHKLVVVLHESVERRLGALHQHVIDLLALRPELHLVYLK